MGEGAWSPDGQTFASGSSDNTVRIWSAADYSLRHICQGHEGIVTSIAYNPTGRQIASASWDKSVRLWEWAVESLESKY
ncbi:MAG: WD40 repeat domain-containing protein [Ardenticatenaceae bacterium]